MLFSLAVIFLLGMMLSVFFQKIGLPKLLGPLLCGIILGPYALNVLDSNILLISSDLRKIALIIILTRAGLSLNLSDLKKAGRPALLLCFLPACFEIAATIFLAPIFLKVTYIEAAVIGAVIAAVSPAVVVPKMLHLMEHKWGTDKYIPQMIMAGASVDDIFVIVLFTIFTSLEKTGTASVKSLADIPISIVLGIVLGFAVGKFLMIVFTKFHIRDSAKVVILLSSAFLMVSLEDFLSGKVAISGLLAVMCCGIMINREKPVLSERLGQKYSKLWVAAEVLLFALVGASVNISYAFKTGPTAVVLLLCALAFRIVGVFVCMLKTDLSAKERLFCAIAYTPKATVQAAIGSAALSMGLACGEIVLTVAVIAILITAPLGAFAIEKSYKKLLTHSTNYN